MSRDELFMFAVIENNIIYHSVFSQIQLCLKTHVLAGPQSADITSSFHLSTSGAENTESTSHNAQTNL